MVAIRVCPAWDRHGAQPAVDVHQSEAPAPAPRPLHRAEGRPGHEVCSTVAKLLDGLETGELRELQRVLSQVQLATDLVQATGQRW